MQNAQILGDFGGAKTEDTLSLIACGGRDLTSPLGKEAKAAALCAGIWNGALSPLGLDNGGGMNIIG